MKIYTNLQKITISESLNPKSFEGEIWKPITGFDGHMISNYARVKRLSYCFKNSLNNIQTLKKKY